MGIFVEETAAFIIGGIIGAAILYTRMDKEKVDVFRVILIIACLLLAAIGILDVAVDHLGSDEPQAATP